jgi:hypothetical protein
MVLIFMSERVKDIGNDKFELICSIVGKVTMTFKRGNFYGKEGYIFTGVTHQYALPLKTIPKIAVFLAQDLIAEVQECVKSFVPMEEGLDGYGPECDNVFCGEHLSTRIEYDDGFYDCMYGTCPKGHERMIDD